jgi:hypothetical protein
MEPAAGDNAAQEKYDSCRRTERAKVEQMEGKRRIRSSAISVDKAERLRCRRADGRDEAALRSAGSGVKGTPRACGRRFANERETVVSRREAADDPVIPSPERWNAFTAREGRLEAGSLLRHSSCLRRTIRIDAEPLDDHFL